MKQFFLFFMGLVMTTTLSAITGKLPVADLLDVVFNADGTAKDVSPLKSTVTTNASQEMLTTYNDAFGGYVARFHHNSPGSTVTPLASSGCYQINYNTNTTILNGLTDGHTIETFFTLKSFPATDLEMKMFSSMEGGGTGFLIGNNSTGRHLYFLPYIGGSYRWTDSGITPELNRWYHVVGVYDKAAGKTYIYVDGVLKSSQTVSGNYAHPNATGVQWFGIGGDAGGNNLQSCWQGDVAIARVYDKALTAQEISDLYDQVKIKNIPNGDILINGINYLSGINVAKGKDYIINGSGFTTGDKIRFYPVSGSGDDYLCDGTVTTSNITIKIPADFVSGKYRLAVVRGTEQYDLGFVQLTVSSEPNTALPIPKIICHRGYWNTAGSAQNSIASLAKAQELQSEYGDMLYGSEFDVWITSDNVVVINHDGVIGDVNIENNTYNAIKDKTLGNGEKIPTLADFLEQGKKNTNVKLICEIKTHSTTANNNRVMDAVVSMVETAGMQNQVEYIAFSWDNCLRLCQKAPYAVVGYLGGDKDPQTLNKAKVKCMDNQILFWQNNNTWVQQVRNLGMVSNVWTVNTTDDLEYVIGLGVNFITTDNPVQLKDLLSMLPSSMLPEELKEPAANLKVRSANGNLLFNVQNPASVIIYMLTGMKVAQLNVENEAKITLPQGIYIVKAVSKNITETIKLVND